MPGMNVKIPVLSQRNRLRPQAPQSFFYCLNCDTEIKWEKNERKETEARKQQAKIEAHIKSQRLETTKVKLTRPPGTTGSRKISSKIIILRWIEINHNEKLNWYTCTGAVSTGLKGLRHRYECGDPWNLQTLILRSKQEWKCSRYNSKTGSKESGWGEQL